MGISPLLGSLRDAPMLDPPVKEGYGWTDVYPIAGFIAIQPANGVCWLDFTAHTFDTIGFDVVCPRRRSWRSPHCRCVSYVSQPGKVRILLPDMKLSSYRLTIYHCQ